jgi:hypothetical protein
MEMPTSMSKADLRVTYGLKKAETGKSLEQRQSDFFRSLYPDAKSTAEARKRYARDMGIDPRKLARSPIGSPLGRLAQKSPVGIARKKVPVAFEEITTVVGGKVKTVKKPIKFKTEESPGIQTLFSAPGQFTPIEDIQEAISSGRIITDMQKIRGGAMETKAATFKSRAEMASRLRNRGLAGEARGREYTRRKKAVEEGKQFQTRFDELTKQNVDQLMGLPAPQPTKIFKNKKRKKK